METSFHLPYKGIYNKDNCTHKLHNLKRMYSDHKTGRMGSSYLTEGKKRTHEEGGIFVMGLKDRKH